MPVKPCVKDGKAGYKWGDAGVCFTGSDAREKAAEVGRAVEAKNSGKDKSDRALVGIDINAPKPDRRRTL